MRTPAPLASAAAPASAWDTRSTAAAPASAATAAAASSSGSWGGATATAAASSSGSWGATATAAAADSDGFRTGTRTLSDTDTPLAVSGIEASAHAGPPPFVALAPPRPPAEDSLPLSDSEGELDAPPGVLTLSQVEPDSDSTWDDSDSDSDQARVEYSAAAIAEAFVDILIDSSTGRSTSQALAVQGTYVESRPRVEEAPRPRVEGDEPPEPPPSNPNKWRHGRTRCGVRRDPDLPYVAFEMELVGGCAVPDGGKTGERVGWCAEDPEAGQRVDLGRDAHSWALAGNGCTWHGDATTEYGPEEGFREPKSPGTVVSAILHFSRTGTVGILYAIDGELIGDGRPAEVLDGAAWDDHVFCPAVCLRNRSGRLNFGPDSSLKYPYVGDMALVSFADAVAQAYMGVAVRMFGAPLPRPPAERQDRAMGYVAERFGAVPPLPLAAWRPVAEEAWALAFDSPLADNAAFAASSGTAATSEGLRLSEQPVPFAHAPYGALWTGQLSFSGGRRPDTGMAEGGAGCPSTFWTPGACASEAAAHGAAALAFLRHWYRQTVVGGLPAAPPAAAAAQAAEAAEAQAARMRFSQRLQSEYLRLPYVLECLPLRSARRPPNVWVCRLRWEAALGLPDAFSASAHATAKAAKLDAIAAAARAYASPDPAALAALRHPGPKAAARAAWDLQRRGGDADLRPWATVTTGAHGVAGEIYWYAACGDRAVRSKTRGTSHEAAARDAWTAARVLVEGGDRATEEVLAEVEAALGGRVRVGRVEHAREPGVAGCVTEAVALLRAPPVLVAAAAVPVSAVSAAAAAAAPSAPGPAPPQPHFSAVSAEDGDVKVGVRVSAWLRAALGAAAVPAGDGAGAWIEAVDAALRGAALLRRNKTGGYDRCTAVGVLDATPVSEATLGGRKSKKAAATVAAFERTKFGVAIEEPSFPCVAVGPADKSSMCRLCFVEGEAPPAPAWGG